MSGTETEKTPSPAVTTVQRKTEEGFVYTLVYPVTVTPPEGDPYEVTQIKIGRCSAAEVAEWLEATKKAPENRMPVLPIFDCSTDVYHGMDDDDRLALEEAALPFLPRRLRQVAEQNSESGDTT